VNWQHFQAFLWLRWRLRVNQLRRGGIANAIVLALLAVACVGLSFGLFVTFFAVGLLVLSNLPAPILMYVWDGLVVAFLFCWCIGLMADLQRADALSLDKVLHLPVSPTGAFLINYFSSFFSVSLLVFLPAMVGLATALIIGRGSALLLLQFPLLAAFLIVVTALTYQFQGWLASLMANQRRRRTIIVLVTMFFVLSCQLPQLIHVVQPWIERQEQQIQDDLRDQNAEVFRALAAHEITPKQCQEQLGKIQATATARKQDLEQQTLKQVEQVVRLANLVLPPGWLPLGVEAAAEGDFLAPLLGTLGLALVAAVSLWRSYRTTLRLYTGQFSSGKRRPAAVAAPVPAGKVSVGLLERDLPWVSDQTAAVALGGFRSLLRAPEAKMMLLSPLIMAVVFGSLLVAHGNKLPDLLRPLVAYGGMGMTLIGLMGVVNNQFGFDRDGFRVFVLCAAPRRDILLGKNLAFAPLALGMGGTVLVLVELVYPMRIDLFLAALPQLLSMFLLFCLLANWVSILAPMRIAAGSFKAANPKLIPILLHVSFVFLFPLVLLPTLLPFGIQVALEEVGGVRGLPLGLLVSVAECVGIVYLYHLVLTWQGRVFHARELKILEVVTTRG
jgi:ABC-2 type transport system permease protein